MATRRVLIVDDEADVRGALADILRAMRYADHLETEGAADGQAGLDAVVRQLPDLVLLDLQMPRMGGLALLRQIHRVDRRLPIIVVTATADTTLTALAPARGRGRVPAQALRSAPRRDAGHHVPRRGDAAHEAPARRALIAARAMRDENVTRGVHVLRAEVEPHVFVTGTDAIRSFGRAAPHGRPTCPGANRTW